MAGFFEDFSKNAGEILSGNFDDMDAKKLGTAGVVGVGILALAYLMMAAFQSVWEGLKEELGWFGNLLMPLIAIAAVAAAGYALYKNWGTIKEKMGIGEDKDGTVTTVANRPQKGDTPIEATIDPREIKSNILLGQVKLPKGVTIEKFHAALQEDAKEGNIEITDPSNTRGILTDDKIIFKGEAKDDDFATVAPKANALLNKTITAAK